MISGHLVPVLSGYQHRVGSRAGRRRKEIHKIICYSEDTAAIYGHRFLYTYTSLCNYLMVMSCSDHTVWRCSLTQNKILYLMRYLIDTFFLVTLS